MEVTNKEMEVINSEVVIEDQVDTEVAVVPEVEMVVGAIEIPNPPASPEEDTTRGGPG